MAESGAEQADGSAKRRFADISEVQLSEIIENKDAKNTKRATDQAARLFRKYLTEKKLSTEFETFDSKQLDLTLSKFYAEARTSDGSLYKKSSLQTLRHGLNRYLNYKNDIDIVKDSAFKESQKVFLAVCKDLKRQGFGGVNHHPPIEQADLHKMYQMFDLNNPKSLQWRVFCDVMLYFGRRGRENLRDLKIMDFAMTTDGEGYRYIYLCRDEQTKNHQDDTNTASGRMYEVRDDDDLCPVKTFVRYKRKLNPKCVFLFQRPSIKPKENIWYDKAPLGPNMLGSLMSDISKEYQLSQLYTNHCLRATTVHILDEAQIAGRHIMTVTGHKSETSLKSYTGYTSTKTKKKMSHTVTESLRSEDNMAMEVQVEYQNNMAQMQNDTESEVKFDLNNNHELVALTDSQVDFLETIVTSDPDWDNDTVFDDYLSSATIPSVANLPMLPALGNSVQKAVTVSNAHPVMNHMNNTVNYSQMYTSTAVPSVPMPVIYNYGTLNINYR